MIFRMFLTYKSLIRGGGGRCLKIWENAKILDLGVVKY